VAQKEKLVALEWGLAAAAGAADEFLVNVNGSRWSFAKNMGPNSFTKTFACSQQSPVVEMCRVIPVYIIE
jgi:hypothetical protein